MEISNQLKSFLDKPEVQNLINNSEWEDLLKKYYFYIEKSTTIFIYSRVNELVNLLKKADLDKNIMGKIPANMAFYNKYLGKKIIIRTKDNDIYTQYNNKLGSIVEPNSVKVYSRLNDDSNFKDGSWYIRVDNNKQIISIRGVKLEIIK